MILEHQRPGRVHVRSVGDGYDNALCESFFASLECERLDRYRFRNHEEARMPVFRYLEGWYKPHRGHSSILTASIPWPTK